MCILLVRFLNVTTSVSSVLNFNFACEAGQCWLLNYVAIITMLASKLIFIDSRKCLKRVRLTKLNPLPNVVKSVCQFVVHFLN